MSLHRKCCCEGDPVWEWDPSATINCSCTQCCYYVDTFGQRYYRPAGFYCSIPAEQPTPLISRVFTMGFPSTSGCSCPDVYGGPACAMGCRISGWIPWSIVGRTASQGLKLSVHIIADIACYGISTYYSQSAQGWYKPYDGDFLGEVDTVSVTIEGYRPLLDNDYILLESILGRTTDINLLKQTRRVDISREWTFKPIDPYNKNPSSVEFSILWRRGGASMYRFIPTSGSSSWGSVVHGDISISGEVMMSIV